ncbi:MAG TPA: sigma 54-interacting transcriptional regulator [Candidatus Acidoferrales bacterium]|nr:sigma 54-interacting transcriptional regulator [Candidatus Acidoferrales bacterium]
MEVVAGRYRLLRQLGQGGMGSAHLAIDLTTRTECVLKRLAAGHGAVAPESLRREFELLARVRHPAVVKVHELGFAADGSPFLTMEFVPGAPADRALRRWDFAALCFAGAEVANGLEALHAANALHGDLKPSNLLVRTTGGSNERPASLKLVDFGLGTLLGRDREGHRGTAGFAAPEVVRGEAPGVASDLYGLGALLYALATGHPAFAGGGSAPALRRQQSAPPPAAPLEEAGLPDPLVQLVLRLMAPVVSQRPSDAGEVRRELERMHPAARRTLEERLGAERVVARERELARLEALIAPSRTGGPVLLTAESGMGKTALLAELAMRATLAGRPVIRLAAPALATPGAVAAPLLRRLAAEAGEDADPAERDAPAAIESDAAGWDDATCTRMAEAGARWARAAHARGARALPLVDDAEHLDERSLTVLRRMLLRADGAGLACVLASRADDARAQAESNAWVAAGFGERVRLGVLSREGTGQLLAARLHQSVPAQLTEIVHERSGGHPGLAVELLRAAARAGALAESASGLVVRAGTLEALATPGDFEGSRLARLGALDAAARAAATALATWSRPVPAELVLALAPDADAAALERLVASDLAVRDADGRVALISPELGRRIHDALSHEARVALHRAALGQPGLAPAERFVHLRETGQAQAALAAAEAALEHESDARLAREATALAATLDAATHTAWLLRSGRALVDAGRHRAAVPILREAVREPQPVEHRAEAWLLLSGALLRVGRGAEVAEAVERGLAEQPHAATRALLLSNASSALEAGGRVAEADELASRAVQAAEESGHDASIAIAAMTWSGTRRSLGRADEALVLAQRAFEASGRSGAMSTRARALGMCGYTRVTMGDLRGAESDYDAAVELARKHALRLALEEVLLNRAGLLGQTGRWRAACTDYEEAARLSLEDGRTRNTMLALANLAHLEALLGRPARARRRGRRALRLARIYLPRGVAFATHVIAVALRVGGDTPSAERLMRRALSMAMPLRDVGGLDWFRYELGLECSQRGDWDEADRVWAAELGEEPRLDSEGRIAVAIGRGRAAVRRDGLEDAERWLDLAEAALRGRTSPYLAAHALQLDAEIALAREDGESGEALGRRTLAAFQALGDVSDGAHAALDFARLAMHVRLSSLASVGGWLEHAAAGFEQVGDHRRRERALSLTVDWLRRTHRAVPARTRERDLIQAVARLLDSLSDLHELARRAMQMAIDHLDAERGLLLLADEASGAITPIVELGGIDAATRDQAVTYSRRVVERVAESGGSLLITDAPTDPAALSQSVENLRLRSIVCVPLHVRGKFVGAVYLDDSRRPDAFRDADRALLEGFAHLIAVAIEKSRGEAEVRRTNEQLVDENLSLRREASQRFRPQNFIGMSTPMQRVRALVERAAQTASTVLVTGEMGTGKEVIARVLHHSGRRRDGPFVMLNCGAVVASLLESELFGILPDIATGVRGRDGCFVQANEGTLFLDEIGEMPVAHQVALLNVLANREVTPVGGGPPRAVDVRIIAATNRDLPRLIEEGKFREDLYYRLNVIPIELPPLRDRKADIPALAQSFAAFFALKEERPVPEFSPEFLAVLMQSDWPGNVRELQNYIERIMALTPGRVLEPTQLPRDLESRGRRTRVPRGRHLREVVGEVERQLVREALERADGNQSLAARDLGIPEQALRYRLRKYAAAEPRRIRRVRRNRR